VRALDDVDLEIRDGEFFGILGPSGSGKTSCLRLIAGFERPTRGTIELHGRRADSLPPFQRDVNTVFQDYALFPHMSVEANVAYGLRVKGVGKRERRHRVGEMLERVRLGGFGDRRPGALSGGQRQRVALARALINRPGVLLLDEPLGALDLKLRQQMQVELRALQRNLGITFIFVTHDQGEALSMSDRLAVFDEGRVVQTGTPREVYERPATRFSAEFVGDSNIVEGGAAAATGAAGAYSLRPEQIDVSVAEPSASAAERVRGSVVDVQFHGASVRYVVALPDGSRMTATSGNRSGPDASPLDPGAEVWLSWNPDDMHRLGEERDPS
jgi:putative spermidine/putrescine transport system ATP-binding protein